MRSNAWSDSKQQVNADGLKYLLDNLILRNKDFSTDVVSKIADIRDKVSELDDQMFNFLLIRLPVFWI